MNRIEVLDQNTIDKIAAGEVVERPASVAKELIENAIDSGANAITVEIKNGGIDFIRITDNGCGIPADQVRSAFLRHATSKLRNINDLNSISSLGFRGEALSSISAVSQVELITRDADSVTGVRYIIEGGVEKSFEEIGAPYGTTFIMRNLFFNTPARAKFLKSSVSEQNAVTSYVEQLALSNPDISFKYIAGGSTKIYTSGNGSLKEAVYQIYGKDAVRQLIPVSETCENVNISGFLGRGEAARGNRNFEIYFVNGRYVRDKIISKAIEDGYQGNLMQHRYPFTILNFEMAKDKVDVNVHPAKLEIRFSRQQEIYAEISEAVRRQLLENQSIPEVTLFSSKKKTDDKSLNKNAYGNILRNNEEQTEIPDGMHAEKIPEAAYKKEGSFIQNQPKEPVKTEPASRSIPEPFEYKRRDSFKKTPELVAEKQITFFENDKITPEKIRRHRTIGQVFETYFLVEMDDKFYIVDQHAAHEKILYEKLIKNLNEHKNLSQMLMPSAVLSLSITEAVLLKENIETFERFGFEIEEFGGREFRITAVPADLYSVDTRELFMEILDGLDEPAAKEPTLLAEKIASKSCKAAVKANMRLSAQEAEKLMDELFALDDPYHCPHGRPVMVSFSHYELDRKFKRIV
ncbi:MAG TPA: DNA mismatch repair endonuclease MutL [Candidatus Alectryocaccobium stercorigallinarum]|nr:DNA mismatch repair endonuclease MutL [Candidatus Alectryocaccobium stercorigallinarum]